VLLIYPCGSVVGSVVVRALSMGWVDPRVGLGCVGNGSKICVFSGFGWVESWV